MCFSLFSEILILGEYKGKHIEYLPKNDEEIVLYDVGELEEIFSDHWTALR